MCHHDMFLAEPDNFCLPHWLWMMMLMAQRIIEKLWTCRLGRLLSHQTVLDWVFLQMQHLH